MRITEIVIDVSPGVLGGGVCLCGGAEVLMFVDRASNRMLRVRLCRDGMYSKSDILGMLV